MKITTHANNIHVWQWQSIMYRNTPPEHPPGLLCQKKNRLTDAPAPAAAPRGANVAKQPGTGNRLGRLYVIIIERLS